MDEFKQDSYEDIDFCLHCPYVECGDCLGRKHALGDLALGSIEPFQTLSPPTNLEFRGKRKKQILELYMLGYTDKEMSEKLELSTGVVVNLRGQMKLPALPPSDTRENRKALVERWLSRD